MLPQLKKFKKNQGANLILGLELIIIGFFLKLCIADRIGIYVEEPFNNPQNFGGAVLLISSFFFSFQIYADFGGYSLIAIGLARVIGIKLIKILATLLCTFNEILLDKMAYKLIRLVERLSLYSSRRE